MNIMVCPCDGCSVQWDTCHDPCPRLKNWEKEQRVYNIRPCVGCHDATTGCLNGYCPNEVIVKRNV